MHDPLSGIAQTEEGDVVFCRIGLKVAHHRCNLGICNLLFAPAGRHIMVGDPESQLRLGNTAATRHHLTEGMKRTLMHIMPVYPEERGPVVAAHNLVRRPQFVDQGLGFVHFRPGLL